MPFRRSLAVGLVALTLTLGGLLAPAVGAAPATVGRVLSPAHLEVSYGSFI